MSRAVEKSTKVDGLDFVDAPLWSVVRRAKCSVYSCESAESNRNTKSGRFFLPIVIFWGASALVFMKTEIPSRMSLACHLALLVLCFAVSNQNLYNKAAMALDTSASAMSFLVRASFSAKVCIFLLSLFATVLHLVLFLTLTDTFNIFLLSNVQGVSGRKLLFVIAMLGVMPSVLPSEGPSVEPSADPTIAPSMEPTAEPTTGPLHPISTCIIIGYVQANHPLILPFFLQHPVTLLQCPLPDPLISSPGI